MAYFNTSFVAFSMDSRRCSSTGFAAPMTEVCGLRRGSQSSLKTKACIQYIWSIRCMVHYGPLHMAFMFSFIYTLTYSKSMCINKYINIYWFGGPHKKNQKNLHIYIIYVYTYIHIQICFRPKRVVCTVLNARFGSFWPLTLGAFWGLMTKDIQFKRCRHGMIFFQNSSRIVLENWESSEHIKKWKLHMENLCFQHVWKSSFSECFGNI